LNRQAGVVVASAVERVPAGMAVRPYRRADAAAVVELINADRLPGQPACTRSMLDEALAGRLVVDAAWWEELKTPTTDVLVEGGHVVGVISYAARRAVSAARPAEGSRREIPAAI
jgi:hypothetical protein